jgi:hemoglobin
VKTFYENLLKQDSIKPLFANVDIDKHMPHMIAFWEFVLLDKEGYKTNVFDKHVNLPLSSLHFELWLSVFETTVHDLFEGEKAEMAIQRAQTIAYSFQSKMKQMGKLRE